MKIKMNLKSNFTLVPEGERILTITKAECTPSGKPNKLKVTFQDSEGGFINSQYNFDNDKSLFAMGKLLETALSFEDGDEFDTKTDTGENVLWETVSNPAVRKVTDWKNAFPKDSKNPISEKAPFRSAIKNINVPEKISEKVIKITIFECKVKTLFFICFVGLGFRSTKKIFVITVNPKPPAIIKKAITRYISGLWTNWAKLSE